MSDNNEYDEQQEEDNNEYEYEYNDTYEEQYEYEYEDDLNNFNLPKINREVSESHFNIPEGTYTLHNYIDIAPLMEKLITEVITLLGVNRNVSELLLRHMKWNHGLLAEQYFNDPKRLLIASGIELEENVQQVNNNNSQNVCLVCYEPLLPGTGHSLNCNHEFCSECYGGYLENLVSDGPSCVTMSCPSYKCPLKISTDTLKSICTTEVYQKYYMYVVRDFIDSSSYMHWCPAPNCGKIALGSELTEIVCQCSFPTCAKCGLESHRPATCKELSKWILKNTNESENSSWILVNTKGCPKCNRRIEKNQGCNHMTCSICRHEFCWICLGDWIGHNGNSYQCNQFVENGADANELRNVKQRLDRYLHYFSRYHSHDQSLKYAIKQRDDVRKSFESTANNEIVSLDLILKAIELVICCRRALKNSYIVGYYDLDSKIADLYEMQQQMLASNTETLSGLTEKKEFTLDDRDHMTNLTTVTVKFLEFMLKYHHDSTDEEN